VGASKGPPATFGSVRSCDQEGAAAGGFFSAIVYIYIYIFVCACVALRCLRFREVVVEVKVKRGVVVILFD